MTREPRAVSVAILKGGVGKSTIAVNLTERLAAKGNNALFIDLDPNGHASVGLGFKEEYQEDSRFDNVLLEDTPPEEIIHQTEWDFDIIPSSNNLETIEDRLRSAQFGDIRLKQKVVDPLLDDHYDYIVTDSPAYRGKLSDNALVATQNLILPLTPGNEALAGFERTMERQIKPIREQIGLNILALVPNMLHERIDQQTSDRVLLEDLNKNFPEYVPSFARITDDEFRRIDNDEFKPSPMPGIRDRKVFTDAFGAEKPVAYYDPDCDQLDHLDTLAEVVVNGGVKNE